METERPISPLTYQPFDLLVRAATAATTYPTVLLESPAGQAEGVCSLDLADRELHAALAEIYAGPCDRAFLREVGTFLFDALFDPEIATLFRTSLGMVRQSGEGLRVQLRIDAPALQALPWELLYDPEEDAWPALAVETTLVRYLPLRLPVRPMASSLPLRLLHVIAAPTDAAPLDTVREQALMRDALQEWIHRQELELTVVERATVAAVSDAMRRIQPHVFHFSGHGVRQDDGAAILLEREDGRSQPVDERAFREFFSASRATRLAVLNACDTAQVAGGAALGGIAPRLLQRQLAAVVAMQAPLADDAALIFGRDFYRAIIAGFSIDAAIAEARKGLFMELPEDAAWGVPVLFLRARDGQLFRWAEERTSHATIPPPEKGEPLPTTSGFVGRREEMAYYEAELAEFGSAVVCGMAGVGKTALAAQLASQWPARNKVFWHTFHAGDDVGSVIWPLAGFLFWNQQPELWNMLQSVQMAGGQPPPLSILFDYTTQMACEHEYLLCLDNLHLVNEDPLLRPLVEKFRPLCAAGEVTLLATSQRVPDYFRPIQPLGGLQQVDTAALAQALNVELAPELLAALQEHTQGNVEFLQISLRALATAPNPADLIRHLAKVSDMRRYLLQQLDQRLTDAEREVESAVAILGVPSPREAIEIVLDADNLRRTLHDLGDRYLLIVTEREWSREYSQHAILQDFYYDYLSRRLRSELHRRAAEYFEIDVDQPVRAVQHHALARDPSRAVSLAAASVEWSINHFQAQALATTLQELSRTRLLQPVRIQTHLTLGQLYAFLGQKDAAEQHFAPVLDYTAVDADASAWRVQALQGMGQVTYNVEPAAARDWLQRALEALEATPELATPGVEASIQADLGWALLRLNELDAAEEALLRSLVLLPAHPSPQRVDTLLRLVQRHLMSFATEPAVHYAEQAAAECQQIEDVWRHRAVIMVQAQIQHAACAWATASERYRQALTISKKLGDRTARCALLINIGTCEHHLGDLEPAQERLTRGAELARHLGLAAFEIKAHLELGQIYTRLEAWTAATDHLATAEALIAATDAPFALDYLPLVEGARAGLQLAQGRIEESLVTVRRAVEHAREQEKVRDLAVLRRVEAEAMLASGHTAAAAEILEEAIAVLDDASPYEAAKAKAVLGAAQVARDRNAQARARGHALMAAAAATFTELGAKLDLADVTSGIAQSTGDGMNAEEKHL